ncbi:MAG: pseudouridylate synthase [Muribaculaceae bacterium]|nr:pseudouridylate synthase [Muribaculaceae bacterium]
MTSGNNPIPDCAALDVLTLLPQRPPIVMIDRLASCEPASSRSELAVRADNIFCDPEGRFTAFGMMENIAQTCAAHIGYCNLISGQPIRLGFIGAMRHARVLRLPRVGERLSTQIDVLEDVFGMMLVAATIKVDGETVCECEMKIALSGIVAQN